MTDNTIAELEARIAFQDDAIEQLSDVIREQWQAIDNLRQTIDRLDRRVGELEDKEELPPNVPPPHY